MPGASRDIFIKAPPEKVFDVLSDYESYGEFLTEVKEVKTSNRQGNQVDIHYKVDVIKTIRYTIRMTEERPHRMSWTFVEGEVMKDNTGGWELKEEGEGTRATYSVEMKLGALVPKAIVNGLVESSLPKMLEAVKARVESRS